jgi:PTH2 family peptidyl-tRNA hydrolase
MSSELPNSFTPTAMLLSTGIVTFLTGFLLGIYSIQGSFVSPALSEERRRNVSDPVESDESEVEDDTLLDHAPNWANSTDADKRDGLRQRNPRKTKVTEGKLVDVDSTPAAALGKPNEECKLVLVVRTDLGMTKGALPPLHVVPSPRYQLIY